jgi:hypothetical protein
MVPSRVVDESLYVPREEKDVRMVEHAGVEEAVRSRRRGQRITKSPGWSQSEKVMSLKTLTILMKRRKLRR